MLPHDGTLAELLRDKIEREPKRPEAVTQRSRRISARLYGDLARARSRPRGIDVLRFLAPAIELLVGDGLPVERHEPATETGCSSGAVLRRTTEVNALHRALQAAEAGQSQVAHVRGISGAGKSALVEHFLNDLEAETSATGRATVLVLRSRCYEREAMPFKALDGVIDALSRHLSTLDDFEVGHLMPADIAALVRVFPTLERLRAVQRLLNVRSLGGDSVQTRQRAELALHDLFSRLAKLRRWSSGSTTATGDRTVPIIKASAACARLPLLLILSHRSDESKPASAEAVAR